MGLPKLVGQLVGVAGDKQHTLEFLKPEGTASGCLALGPLGNMHLGDGRQLGSLQLLAVTELRELPAAQSP